MKNFLLVLMIVFWVVACSGNQEINGLQLVPESGSKRVNPDTRLKITFSSQPVVGKSGKIRVYETETGRLVDSLDLSKPAGPVKAAPKTEQPTYTTVPYDYSSTIRATNANTKPGTPSGVALPTSDEYQLTIIGGFSDGFHFYPVIVRRNTATIYLHHNLLEYGKEYCVTIEPEVFEIDGKAFGGICQKDSWVFQTCQAATVVDADFLTVSADGKGDFNTIQGAMDFIPDWNTHPVTVMVKNGVYEELVYFRNKNHVTIVGENRDSVVVHYANNEVFNPHPVNVFTNEVPGTFPSRRAAFMADNCRDMRIRNMTIMTTLKGQAEGLLVMGERNILENLHIVGSEDALQVNGSIYIYKCTLNGGGDAILGRGPAFFQDCQLYNTGGPFMWIRNTEANHGNVFVNCVFRNIAGGQSSLARLPANKGKYYPYAEAVLINCCLEGITPEAWENVQGETDNMRFWEYNSINVTDGKPVDISLRNPVSRQLIMPQDSAVIREYSDPEFVLGGWKPSL